jgi:hypothetical protein
MFVKLECAAAWIALVGLLVTGNGASADARNVTLVYSANLNGELEPCGCAEESNLGGIRRQAYKVTEWRRTAPDLFLVSSGGLLVSELPSDRTKSEYILKGLAAMQYDAVGLQWRDLAFGADFLRATPLHWVSSNAAGEAVPKQQRVRHGATELAVFSWLDPREAPMMVVPPHADSKALADALRDAKKSGAITVLLTTLPLEEARTLVPLADLDILVLRAPDETFGAPQRLGNTLVLTPGTRGMRLGRVDFTVGANNRIGDYKHEVTKLPAEVPDAAELDGWYKEYTAKLKEDYLKRVDIRKALNAGTPEYVGAEACKTCHLAEHEKWTTTKHSHAWAALEGVNKIYDPNCVGCHVVGYEKSGGYIDPAMTEHLTNVQCENCHGAARAHVDSGGAKPVANKDWPPRQMCGQCHIGSHSPSFKFEEYWPRIAHGRRDTK